MLSSTAASRISVFFGQNYAKLLWRIFIILTVTHNNEVRVGDCCQCMGIFFRCSLRMGENSLGWMRSRQSTNLSYSTHKFELWTKKSTSSHIKYAYYSSFNAKFCSKPEKKVFENRFTNVQWKSALYFLLRSHILSNICYFRLPQKNFSRFYEWMQSQYTFCV